MNAALCHPVFSFKFCRTEFSLYHPLHGRHFLTHHPGDCLRLLETLQKVPALLSSPFSLIGLKQATINLTSLHCCCRKVFVLEMLGGQSSTDQMKNKEQSNWLNWKEVIFYIFRLLFVHQMHMVLHLIFQSQSGMLLTKIHHCSIYRKRQELARQSRQNVAEQSNGNHEGNDNSLL